MSALLAQTDVEIPEIVWSAIWPLVLLSLGGVLLITVTSISPSLRGRSFPAAATIGLAIVSLATLPSTWNKVQESGGQLAVIADALRIDAFTLLVTGVMCMALILVSLLLDDYLRAEGLDGPEWYVLLLMSATGGILMASANDLIVTFLGLEILSIAVYVLAALHLRRTQSQEAGFKYFILGALSSAIFLYGIAMIYGATGSLRLTDIAVAITSVNEAGLSPITDSSLLLAGMAMLLIGFGFKISAAPFHLWTPDVYEGAPTPVVAFMSSAVKAAGVAGLLRVFIVAFGAVSADWRPVVGAMAVLSVVIGATSAIGQNNVKRMLAYSSIVHAGFMLVGLYAAASGAPTSGTRSVVFYLFAYSVMSIGTFAAFTLVGGRGDENHTLQAYQGLARTQPLLAAMLAVLLFAQAGMPFTIGFWAKARVILAAADSESYLIAAVAMVAAVVAAFVYLRLIVTMFMSSETAETPANISRAGLVTVGLTVAITMIWGVLPGFFGAWFEEATRALLQLR
jgi:NADH-quinone oxidoreductase subunit N